jgi:hypothetical protein
MIMLSFGTNNEVHQESIWDDGEYYFLKYFLLRNALKYFFIFKIYYWYKHTKII